MSRPDLPKDTSLPTDPDARRRRILFRATHRGTCENDILIGGFVSARLVQFTDSELDGLERILEFPEPALADWLTGRQPIPPEADSPLLRAMRQAALDPRSRHEGGVPSGVDGEARQP